MRTTTMLAAGVVLALLLALPIGGHLSAQAVPDPVTTAQAEGTRPGVPPASVPPSETLGWMLTLGIVSNMLMRKAKDAAWLPWLRDGAGKVNVAVAALLAAAAALGIHTEFDAAGGTLLISGLTGASLLHFAGEWLRQYALQHLTYRAMARE